VKGEYMNKVTFYFDFVSPYSYLAQTQIAELAEQTKSSIEYVPVFLAGLHKLQKVTSPAFIPSKAQWIIRDCHMWADQYQLPLKWSANFPFNSIALLRTCLWLQQSSPSEVAVFVDKTFKAIWEHELDVSNMIDVSNHLQAMGLDPEEVLQGTGLPNVKQALKDNGDLAAKKEMFGLPVFEVSNKLYFGQDRLHFVKQALMGKPLNDGPR
jgi:2-hydroxychromene-2-carboxylate isomerase